MRQHILCALVALGLMMPALAQSEDTVDIVGDPIDPLEPPEHLKDSALIRFLQSRNTSVLPFPIQRLIRELSYEDYAPVSTFVPRGRSAQVKNTDEFSPRTVIASAGANKIAKRAPIGFEDYSRFRSPDWEGHLFFGHADRDQTIESISLNVSQRRNDYFVIKNYGRDQTGKLLEPQIIEVKNRQACTKCHLNEAAIYPPQPWSEMVNHDPRRFLDARDNKQPTDFANPPTLYTLNGVLLSQEFTPFVNNSNLAIGFSTLVNNRLIQAYKVFATVCGASKSCKRTLLLAALSNPNQSDFIRKNVAGGDEITTLDTQLPYDKLMMRQVPDYFWENLSYLDRNWSVNDYAYITGFIPDISAVVNGSVDPVSADPQSPRAPDVTGVPRTMMVQYLYDTAFDAFGFNYQQERAIKRFRMEDLTRLVQNLGRDPEVEADLDHLFTNWLPTPTMIMNFLKKHLANAANFELVEDEASNPFVSYCQSCHAAGTGNPEINFRDLENLEPATKNLTIQYLSDGSMPPQEVTRRPTAEDVQSMLALIGSDRSNLVAGSKGLTHLSTPILKRFQQKRSYIIDQASTAVEDGFKVTPLLSANIRSCQLVPARQTSGFKGFDAGRTEDGEFLLALENFPRFIPGNLIQTFVLPAGNKCMVGALTLNGQLVVLNYNAKLRVVVEIPLKMSLSMRYVAVSDNRILGIGSDQNIYSLSIDLSSKAVSQQPVSTQGNGNLTFARLRGLGRSVWIAQSFKGERFLLTYRNNSLSVERVYGLTVLNWQGSPFKVSNLNFNGNLLDRTSWLIIPANFTSDEVNGYLKDDHLIVEFPKDAVVQNIEHRRAMLVLQDLSIKCQQNGNCTSKYQLKNTSTRDAFRGDLELNLFIRGTNIPILNEGIQIGPRKQQIIERASHTDLKEETWSQLKAFPDQIQIDVKIHNQSWQRGEN